MVAPPLTADAGLDGVDGASPIDVWAVGSYFGGRPPFIFHWDGSRWTKSAQEPTNGAVLYEVAAISTADAWAVGYDDVVDPLMMHWDGAIWGRAIVPVPGSDNFAYDVAALSSSQVWVVGSYEGSQGTIPMVLYWDGTSWDLIPTVQPPHGGEFKAVWPAAPNDVWAVGDQGGAIPGEFFPLIEHFDGITWTMVDPEPPPSGDDNQFYDVAGDSSTDVWAVGYWGHVTSHPLAEHWDGTSWTLASVPDRGGDFNNLYAVSMASSADVWAAGQYVPDSQTGEYYPLLEHWNGTRWTQMKPVIPQRSGNFQSIAAVSADDVWAVGAYDPGVGLLSLKPLIEHSNGCQP